MAFDNPTITAFKEFFDRDFPYGIADSTVKDSDIGKAYQLVNISIRQGNFSTQENYQLGYMYFAAHYLVLNLQSSSQGISGQYDWMTTNKSVGSVSEGFEIPQRIKDDPYFAMLTKTNYGARYLEILLPGLTGQVFNVFGSTRP